MKLITGIGAPRVGRMLVYDAFGLDITESTSSRSPYVALQS